MPKRPGLGLCRGGSAVLTEYGQAAAPRLGVPGGCSASVPLMQAT